MPTEIKLNVPAGIDTTAAQFSDEMKTAVQNATFDVQRQVMNIAPVVTGTLRRSINSRVETIGGKPVGTIGTKLKYAPYVEYGTGIYHEPDAHKPFRAKIPDVGWRYIKGMKPRKFFVNGFDQKRDAAVQRMQKALQAFVERMGK